VAASLSDNATLIVLMETWIAPSPKLLNTHFPRDTTTAPNNGRYGIGLDYAGIKSDNVQCPVTTNQAFYWWMMQKIL
jgi:hypothetical protein